MNDVSIKDLQPRTDDQSVKVGIVSCGKYDDDLLYEKLIKGFDLFGGISRYIGPGKKVFIKPNFLVVPRTPDDPAVTNPAVLYALSRIVKDCGARPFLGDSPAFGTVRKVLHKLGYYEKLKGLGVELVQLKRTVKVKRLVAGEEKTFSLSRDVHESDFVINVPKLKVHCQLMMSLTIKNLFGCVPGKRKAWRHLSYGDKGDSFARMIAETYAAVSPGFTVLDSIVGMERNGPRKGDPSQIGLLFFGEDCLAIERVVAEVLRMDPYMMPVFRAAANIDVGESKLENIEVLGESFREIGPISLVPSDRAPIRFSPLRVVKSAIKNMWISRIRKPL